MVVRVRFNGFAGSKLNNLLICYIRDSLRQYIYGLLTKREVKMDRDEVEVHKHAKKERGQYPAILTEQAWSMNHNMINVPCGT